MSFLRRFIHRYPWIFVVLAFLLLITAWTTAYILSSGVSTAEVPLTPPASHAK